MKRLLTLSTLAVLSVFFLLALDASAATFYDNFSGGIDATWWKVGGARSDLYSVNTTGGAVNLAWSGGPDAPGGFRNVELSLDLSALTGGAAIAGDFSVRVGFSNANLSGGGLNQVELHTRYSDGSYFYDVREASNVHVWWADYPRGGFNESGKSGTLTISRTGGVVTGYLDGSFIWSTTDSSALTYVGFALQNNNGSIDPTTVTFDNFSITAAEIVPIPGALWLLAPGMAGLAGLKKRLGR